MSSVAPERTEKGTFVGREHSPQGGRPPRPGAGRLRRRHEAPQHGLSCTSCARPTRTRASSRSTSARRSRRRACSARSPATRSRSSRSRSSRSRPPRAGSSRTTRWPSGRARFVGDPVAAVVATTRELARDAAELIEVEYEPLPAVVDARVARDAGDAADPRGDRQQRELGGRVRVGRRRRRLRRGRPRRRDRRAALRPLQLHAARARRGAGRVQPRHRAVDDLLQQPVPGLRRDHDGPRARRRPRQAAHGHAGHRRRLRQQDHVAPAARRLLPAGPQAQPPRAVDGGAHRLPPVDVARQRALVPGRRGGGQGQRRDARLPLQGARRRRRVPALRAARRRDLGAGRARHVPLAQHPRRVLAGHHQQGAGLAQPRLLAHAAPLADRAHHRHRRARARLRSGRAAQAQLRAARADAVPDAERLRLRLGRLPARARHAARADRARGHRGAARRREGARQAARLRHRLDARLRHEQLRAVDLPQPGAAVLGQQRGRDGQARHLRRDRRHARHDAAGPGPRDDDRPGRRRHPRLLDRRGHGARRATTRTGTRTPASRAPTRASSRSPASRP